MWFKSLQVYRLPAPWAFTPEQMEAALAPHAFALATSADMGSQGWDSPRKNGALVHVVNKQMLILLGKETKLLPKSVINQVAKAKAVEIEEAQGFKLGRKQMRDLTEQVTDELLPRAFSIRSDILTWIDPVNGWLVVNATSPAKADEVVKALLKAVDKLPVENLRVQYSPTSVMTAWLQADDAPAGFTVDMDATMVEMGEGKATVNFKHHTLDADDVRRIATGKQCSKLAMTWDSKISFVLTDTLAIKGVKPLDVIKETEASAKDDEERFDGDFMLMTGELSKMLTDVVVTMGGVAVVA